MSTVKPAPELEAAADLEQALGAVTNKVTIKGKEIEVNPLQAQQLSDILKKVWALKERGTVSDVVERSVAAVAEGADPETIKETVGRIDWVRLFMLGGDEVLEILRLGTYQRRETVGTLNVLELVNLAKKFVEVNVDFFLQNLPALKEMFGVMKEAKAVIEEEVGPEASTDSSTTATG